MVDLWIKLDNVLSDYYSARLMVNAHVLYPTLLVFW